ncbi:unnamed protein product, partial [Sphacelaria rigidula]
AAPAFTKLKDLVPEDGPNCLVENSSFWPVGEGKSNKQQKATSLAGTAAPPPSSNTTSAGPPSNFAQRNVKWQTPKDVCVNHWQKQPCARTNCSFFHDISSLATGQAQATLAPTVPAPAQAAISPPPPPSSATPSQHTVPRVHRP